MRNKTLIATALFSKHPDQGVWETVALPHTWNALDGQDGGGDYDRGAYTYWLALPEPCAGKKQYIQFEGSNHITSVYAGDTLLGIHEGGFSTFRFELTHVMAAGCRELRVVVDNRPSHVYPQQADFTFFGGVYRAVTFLEVEAVHFDLMYHGTDGIFVTPRANGEVEIQARTIQAGGCTLVCSVLDPAGREALHMTAPAQTCTQLKGTVENPLLWDGLEAPNCYTARLTLVGTDGAELDQVETRFGFRTFTVDPDKGFFLNGRSYPLRGVSRHQDRMDKGWAISRADHKEDLALIREVGANYIRLAHYQHDSYFYDLCDAAGMVLWAEIPFITVFMSGDAARENTLSQMTELVLQNYNHPSICFWGISNEITVGGDSPALQENLRALNDLVHLLDPSRLTTMAQVTMLPMDSLQNQITDVMAYNHYFGWYTGSVEQNGPWLDDFHRKYPNRCLGVSEYGAETVLNWHTSAPRARDYSEEYQSEYHQKMLETFSSRPYLWSTAAWNMFDFAADARDEGGSRGRNNKGLVTYDRKIKKDSFYVYKAWWSKEPFVHVAGRRFVDRGPQQRDIKVYSNQSQITLFVNGTKVNTQTGSHVFTFSQVPLRDGPNTITARCGTLEDTITLNGVACPNPDYILPGQDDTKAGVTNWFADIQADGQMEYPEGYFSLRDTMGDIMANPEAAAFMEKYVSTLFGSMAETVINMSTGTGMMTDISFEQVIQFTGTQLPEKGRLYLNQQLNQIKK
jgi:beta-galactosidase